MSVPSHVIEMEPAQERPISSTCKIFSSLLSVVKNHGFVIFNCASDSVNKFLNVAFWLAQGVDLVAGLDGHGKDEYFSSMSYTGFMVGGTAALIVSVGSIYTHFILNTNASYETDQRQFSFHDEDSDLEINPEIEVTILQNIFLWMDAIVHVGDSAGNWLVLFNLAQMGTDPDVLSSSLALFATTVIGVNASVANARTCWYNMRLHNKNIALGKQSEDDTILATHINYFEFLTQLIKDSPNNLPLLNVHTTLERIIQQAKKPRIPPPRQRIYHERLALLASPKTSKENEDSADIQNYTRSLNAGSMV